MIKTQIYLTQDDYNELRREAFETKRTMSDIVRKLIQKDLRKTEVNLEFQVEDKVSLPGEFLRNLSKKVQFKGPSELSTNIDHFLYGTPKKR